MRSTSKDRPNCVCMASSKRCATYRFILSLDGVFSPNSRCWKSESYYNISWYTISVTHYLYIDANSSTFCSWCDNTLYIYGWQESLVQSKLPFDVKLRFNSNYRRLVSSVGRAPVCLARGLKTIEMWWWWWWRENNRSGEEEEEEGK